MPDLIGGLAGALLEVFFEATGRRLLNLFGWRQPHQITSFIAGVALWIVVAVLAYVVFSG